MGIRDEVAAFATIQSRLTAALSTPSRPWSLPVSHRGMLIHGPRGIGKTHYLLRHAQANAGFYLSTDQPLALARPLCEWTEFLISRGHRTLYLDEIHQSPEWAAHLKATYDAHPEVSIMVSGSSSLLATAGVADLSRRFVSARVRVVRKTRDKPVLSIGAKLFLADPSLYRALSGQEGNAREAFVACAIESAGMTLHAESDERRGDFIVDGSIRIEVGGRTKERKSADVVVRDGLDVPSPGVLPLWSLGFLW